MERYVAVGREEKGYEAVKKIGENHVPRGRYKQSVLTLCSTRNGSL